MHLRMRVSDCARSLANDPLGLLKGHDALPLVFVRMFALGFLKQEHDTLTLIRWELPRIPIESNPARRLA